MDKNRRCILSCNFAVVIVRILSALTGLGLGCAAGWAIYRASIIYNDATANNWQTSGACASGKSQQEFAVFLGLMGVYFVLCGIFIFLAEIRHYRLQVTVLRPFGFLQTWMGRGVFLVIVGSIFINLPVDSRLYISYIPASFCIAMGVLQIIVSIFVRKEQAKAANGTGSRPPPGRTMTWGSVGDAKALDDDNGPPTPSAAFVDPEAAGSGGAASGPATPSKKPPLVATGKQNNTVETKNPFLKASAAR